MSTVMIIRSNPIRSNGDDDIMMVTVNKYCDIEEDDDDNDNNDGDNDNNDGDDDCYSVEVQRSQPQSSSQLPTV